MLASGEQALGVSRVQVFPFPASEGTIGILNARAHVTASKGKKSPSHHHPCQMCPPPWEPGSAAAPRLAPRVEERDGRLLEAQRRLQEERQRSVVLEQRLGRMHLEPGRTASQRSASSSKTGRPGPGAQGRGGEAWRPMEEPVSSPSRRMWEAEAPSGWALPVLLPPVLFPRPPRQTQEPQSAFAPGGPGPAHL